MAAPFFSLFSYLFSRTSGTHLALCAREILQLDQLQSLTCGSEQTTGPLVSLRWCCFFSATQRDRRRAHPAMRIILAVYGHRGFGRAWASGSVPAKVILVGPARKISSREWAPLSGSAQPRREDTCTATQARWARFGIHPPAREAVAAMRRSETRGIWQAGPALQLGNNDASRITPLVRAHFARFFFFLRARLLPLVEVKKSGAKTANGSNGSFALHSTQTQCCCHSCSSHLPHVKVLYMHRLACS